MDSLIPFIFFSLLPVRVFNFFACRYRERICIYRVLAQDLSYTWAGGKEHVVLSPVRDAFFVFFTKSKWFAAPVNKIERTIFVVL